MASSDISTVIDPLDDVILYIDGATARLLSAIATITDEAAGAAVNINQGVADSINEQFINVSNNYEAIAQDLTQNVSDSVANVNEFITTNYDLIANDIDDITVSSLEYIGGIANDVSLELSDLSSDGADYLSGFYDDVQTSLLETVGEVDGYLTDSASNVTEYLGTLYEGVSFSVQDTYRTVESGITSLVSTAEDTWHEINSDIGTFIGEFLDPIEGTIVGLLETVSDVVPEIGDLANDLVESAKENIADPINALPETLLNLFTDRLTESLGSEAEDNIKAATQSLFGQSPVVRDIESFRNLFDHVFFKGPLWRIVGSIITSPLILLKTVNGIAEANGQIVLQEHAKENPYRLLDPALLDKALHRGAIDESTYEETYRRWGFTGSDSEIHKIASEELAPAGELLSWFLREIISEDKLQASLKEHGFSDDTIASLKEAAFYVPPVQDLISMAVREVFSPDIAARFGQFDEYPEDLTVHAKAQGVSEEWAKNYWAAHWGLPSPTMGFQMLHRRIINEDDLNRLMKALDIMPFWRDKITALSYSPLTRVDVRRMHALGVLTKDQVKEAYLDLGYNEKNANLLSDFVEQYNGVDDSEAAKEAEGLTRASILNFYKDGIINFDDAIPLLMSMGISETVADLFLTSIDLDIERADRDSEKKLIVENAKAGLITFDQANDQLVKLGFDGVELKRVVNLLLTEEAKQTKLPSKADLDKMLVASIISVEVYKSTMIKLGYSNEWIERYIQLKQKGDDDGEE